MADFSGFLHCLDLKTGKPYWTHDMFAAIWGSPMIIDDKIYLGDEDGDVTVLQHGKELKVLAEQNMGSSVYATAVPANGKLFIMNRNQLWALEEGATLKRPSPSESADVARRDFDCRTLRASRCWRAVRESHIARRRRAAGRARRGRSFVAYAVAYRHFVRGLIPDTLKRLWAWEGGEVIESSPAIVNGVVLRRHRHRRTVASGTRRWTPALAIQGR